MKRTEIEWKGGRNSGYRELVSQGGDGYYMVTEVNSWLVKTIQELKAENLQLKTQNAACRKALEGKAE